MSALAYSPEKFPALLVVNNRESEERTVLHSEAEVMEDLRDAVNPCDRYHFVTVIYLLPRICKMKLI
ncbi:hypothetical protein QQG55_47465 [Brugia pahangi]|uniref:Uncharacterized protein n=1 Tax=Brugia pahangi TaxID=6280 RepID=A0A0N4TM73_BRUPA|nr:unnamed protein product [Brugia pahangi]